MIVSAWHIGKHDLELTLTDRELLRGSIAGLTLASGNPLPLLLMALSKDDKALPVYALAAGADAMPASAAVNGADIADKISKASEPIKQLLIGIADPVCYIVFVWGLLETMLGKGQSGLNRMKYAALGYAALNWLPVLMQILREAKP